MNELIETVVVLSFFGFILVCGFLIHLWMQRNEYQKNEQLRKEKSDFCAKYDKVTVDRSIAPVFPPEQHRVLHPDLQITGPTSFLLSELELYTTAEQVEGTIDPQYYYKHMVERGLIERCLGLRDAEEMMRLGKAVFEAHFPNEGCFIFWKSTIEIKGVKHVPCLYYVLDRSFKLGFCRIDFLPGSGNGITSYQKTPLFPATSV